MEHQLCVLACSAAGETGALLLALIAFAYGGWQRHRKVATDGKVSELAAKTHALETEIKVLTLRPAPVPVIIQPNDASSPPPFTVRSPPPPPPPAPPTPLDEQEPDESLGRG